MDGEVMLKKIMQMYVIMFFISAYVAAIGIPINNTGFSGLFMPVAVGIDIRQQGNITILGNPDDALQFDNYIVIVNTTYAGIESENCKVYVQEFDTNKTIVSMRENNLASFITSSDNVNLDLDTIVSIQQDKIDNIKRLDELVSVNIIINNRFKQNKEYIFTMDCDNSAIDFNFNVTGVKEIPISAENDLQLYTDRENCYIFNFSQNVIDCDVSMKDWNLGIKERIKTVTTTGNELTACIRTLEGILSYQKTITATCKLDSEFGVQTRTENVTFAGARGSTKMGNVAASSEPWLIYIFVGGVVVVILWYTVVPSGIKRFLRLGR